MDILPFSVSLISQWPMCLYFQKALPPHCRLYSFPHGICPLTGASERVGLTPLVLGHGGRWEW